jgi:hypothetical protein
LSGRAESVRKQSSTADLLNGKYRLTFRIQTSLGTKCQIAVLGPGEAGAMEDYRHSLCVHDGAMLARCDVKLEQRYYCKIVGRAMSVHPGNQMSSFVESIQTRLSEAGLGEAELVSATPESPGWGHTEAVFRIEPFLLRFVLDHKLEFVDLASEAEPETFLLLDDVAVAMGWWSLEDIIARSEPEPIGAILQRVKSNFTVLVEAFSAGRESLTRARIKRVNEERTNALFDGRFAKKYNKT